MFKQLIHKLKLRFGKKTKVAASHIISGVTHATDEALNDCWGSVALVDQRKPKDKEHVDGYSKTL